MFRNSYLGGLAQLLIVRLVPREDQPTSPPHPHAEVSVPLPCVENSIVNPARGLPVSAWDISVSVENNKLVSIVPAELFYRRWRGRTDVLLFNRPPLTPLV